MLAIAALLAVAVAPVVILDAGFLLSFGATLGILLGVPLLGAVVATGRGRPRSAVAQAGLAMLCRLLAATVCAEIALAPVAATLFGRVSFAGFVLNFAAIPLMTRRPDWRTGRRRGSASAMAPLARRGGHVVHVERERAACTRRRSWTSPPGSSSTRRRRRGG